MGQKSNKTTLRKSKLQYLFLSESTKNVMFFIKYYKLMKNLFHLRGLSLTNFSLNKINNNIFVTFSIFYSLSKIISYQKILSKKNKFLNKKTLESIKDLFNNSLINSNLIILNIKILNKRINKTLLKNLYLKFRYSKKTIFARRYTLFMDFLAISSLYSQGLIKTSMFLKMLGKVFKVLPKNKHRLFMLLLQKLFLCLITQKFLLSDLSLSKSKIRGIKFVLSGRFLGKLRSSSNFIQLGKIPLQTLDSNIEYSQINVHTLLGSFGFKLWVLRN